MRECGKAKILYMGYLAELAGAREVEVELCGEKPLEEIARIPEEIPLDELVILVNGKTASKKTKVKPGDKIAILPHISGGWGKRRRINMGQESLH